MATTPSSSRSRKPATHAAVQHRTRKDIWQVPAVLNVRAASQDDAIQFAAQLDQYLRSGQYGGLRKDQAALNPASLGESATKVKALNDMLAASTGASIGAQDPTSGTDMDDAQLAAALAAMFGAGDSDDDPFASADDI